MKRKIFLTLALALMFCFLFVVSASAEVTTYDDAPTRTNIEIRTDDVIVFYDGFTCPSAYVFKDSKSTPDGAWTTSFKQALDFEYINGKTGKTYEFEDIKEMDIPQGVTYVGKYSAYKTTTLKKVSFPNSVTTLGQCIFEGATGLEECIFEHGANDGLKTIPTYMFSGNTSLKAISLPDCITAIKGVYQFSGCTSLTAVHLPANLETMEGGTQRAATFDGCNKMYFVNEAFTYDDVPEKPSIYYFPKNFSTIGDGCIFRNCNSMNQFLVFDTAMTNVPNLYTFENTSGSTLVFLGDTENLVAGGWKNTNIIFANPSDIDDESAGLARSGKDGNSTKTWGGTAYFCYAEGNTEHFAELTGKTSAADCENAGSTYDVCFCGTRFNVATDVNAPALGHAYESNKVIAVAYADLAKNGTYTVQCDRCDHEEASAKEKSALFVYNGISTNGTGKLCVGYLFNQDAITLYKQFNENANLSFGFVAAATDYIGNNSTPLDGNGNAVGSNVIKYETTEPTLTGAEFILNGDFSLEENANLNLTMGLYVINNGSVSYVYNTETDSKDEASCNAGIKIVTYTSVKEAEQAKQA